MKKKEGKNLKKLEGRFRKSKQRVREFIALGKNFNI